MLCSQIDASDLLDIYPAVRAFFHECLSKSEPMRDEVASLLKLCRVCDFVKLALTDSSWDPDETADSLKVAVAEYLEAFKQAYGEDQMRFKHHQLLHVPQQIKKDRMLLACWGTERKNKHLLMSAHHHNDAKTLSKAVLARAITVQVSFSSVCVPAVFTAMDLSWIPH